jgi:hypothetical protein
MTRTASPENRVSVRFDVGQVQRCTRLPRTQWGLPRVCGQNRRPEPGRSGVPHIRGRPRRRCGHHGSAEPAHMVNCPFE